MSYSFRRPLTCIEWVILRGNARRTRSIDLGWQTPKTVDFETTKSLLKPPTSESLFPNLRRLAFYYASEESALLLLPSPFLISLDITIVDRYPRLLCISLESFAKTSPKLKRLSIFALPRVTDLSMSQIDSHFMCQWQNLRTASCPQLSLDMDTLVHLSRTSALTELAFTLSDTFPEKITPSDSPLSFPHILRLTLHCQSLASASRLFSHIRLPVITCLVITFSNCLSERDLSFFVRLPTSNVGHTNQRLCLVQFPSRRSADLSEDPHTVLGFEHLQPCMAFNNLCDIQFSMKCKVNLVDSELLILASAWPRLTGFCVSRVWGSLGGITPNGLLQLLRRCPSLHSVELAMDVRGYTECPPSSTSLGLSAIDVLDSHIEAESVPAVSAFFSGIFGSHLHLLMKAWTYMSDERVPDSDRAVYKERWTEVCRRVQDAIGPARRLTNNGVRVICRTYYNTHLVLDV